MKKIKGINTASLSNAEENLRTAPVCPPIKSFKIAAAVLVALFAITIIACKSSPGPVSEPGPGEACYGRWEDSINSSQWVIINADSLEYYSGNKLSYRMENLTWTVYENTSSDFAEDYPAGFAIRGNLIVVDIDNKPYDFNEHYYDINEIFTDYWYIHTDGKSLAAGLWASDKHEPAGAYPYIKK